MKKVLLSLALGLVVVFSMSTAQAAILDGWRLDLSTIAGGGNHTNIDHLIMSGTASIVQDFGGDGIFNDGDTFLESFTLFSVSMMTEPGFGAPSVLGLNGYNLYAYGINTTGSVYDVSGSGPADWEFDYIFDPFQQLNLVLDTDTDPTNGGTILLANGTIIVPSGGVGNPGFLGGSGVNGTTNMSLVLTNLANGVFFDSSNTDLSLLPAGYVTLGFVNTHNLVTSFVSGQNGFTTIVSSNGDLNIGVIPEPATMLLLGGGLLGLFGAARRKKKA